MKLKYNPKEEIKLLRETLNDFSIKDKNKIKKITFILKSNIKNTAFQKFLLKDKLMIDLLSFLLKLKKESKTILNKVISIYFKQEKIISEDFLRLLNENDFNLLQNNYLINGIKSDKHTESVLKICKENKEFYNCIKILKDIYDELSYKESEYKKYLEKINFFKLVVLVNKYVTDIYLFLKKEKSLFNALMFIGGASIAISEILNEKRKLDNKIYNEDIEEICKHIYSQDKITSFKIVPELIEYYNKKRWFEESIKNIVELDMNYSFKKEALHIYPKNPNCFINLKNKEILKNKILFFEKGILSEDKDIQKNTDDLNKKTAINICYDIMRFKKLFGEEVLGINCMSFFQMFYKLAERSIRMYENNLSSINKGWGATNYRSIKEFSFATFDKNISTKQMTEEEVRKYIELLATDINNHKEKINLETTPFLKYNDIYIWGHPFLVYKDLFILLNNNLFIKNINNISLIRNLSKKFENSVKNIFEYFHIKNILNCSIKNEKISKYKDIDILAFKENYLFIIEIKLTYDRLNHWSINKHNITLRKAKKQLLDRIKNIDLYLTDENKEKLGINNNNFKIIPLIITSSFEGEFNQGDEILKLSIFELEYFLKSSSGIENLYLKKNVIEEEVRPNFKNSLECYDYNFETHKIILEV